MDWDALCREIARIADENGIEGHIVGGAVRDWVLRRPVKDVDLVVVGSASTFGRILASRIGASFVALDEERDFCRVVVSADHDRFHIDICPMGDSLTTEMLRRDFTINSLSIPFGSLPMGEHVRSVCHDLSGGLGDLTDGIIRQTNASAMVEDPLRCLRAVRLSCQLNFTIEPSTCEAIRHAAPLLSNIAAERIRDEFLSLLSSGHAVRGIRTLQDVGILSSMLPEVSALFRVPQNRIHHLDVFEHTLEAVRNVEQILDEVDSFVPVEYVDCIRNLADQSLGGFPIRSFIKLGALLHDIGKPRTFSLGEDGAIHFYQHDSVGEAMSDDICARLRLSREQTRLISTIVGQHSRPGLLLNADTVTARARRRLFQDLGRFALETFVVCIADRRAARGPVSTVETIEAYETFVFSLMREFMSSRQNPPTRILSGDDLLNELNLTPGPRIGRILGIVEEAQADGIIHTREEALDLARRCLEEVSE